MSRRVFRFLRNKFAQPRSGSTRDASLDSARALWSAQAGLRCGLKQNGSLYFTAVANRQPFRNPKRCPATALQSTACYPERRHAAALQTLVPHRWFGVRRHVCALVSRLECADTSALWIPAERAPGSSRLRQLVLRNLAPRSAQIQSGVMPPHS